MNRQYIKLPHIIMLVLSYVFMVASIIMALVYVVNSAGTEVPTHFDISGEADAYGSAGSIMMLPVIFLITNISLTFMLFFYSFEYWNHPMKKINPNAAKYVYSDDAWLLTFTVFSFSVLSAAYVATAVYNPSLFTVVLIPIVVILLVVTTGLIVKMNMDNKKYA